MPVRMLTLLVVATAIPGCASDPAERGHRLYMAHGCAVCHGAEGHGDGPTAPRLPLPPRDLSDARLYARGASAADVARSIRRGTASRAMPAFNDLTDAEADDIAAWIVSQQRQ